MSKATNGFGREMRDGINRILMGLKVKGPFSQEKKIKEEEVAEG